LRRPGILGVEFSSADHPNELQAEPFAWRDSRTRVERFGPHLIAVDLGLGDVIYESGSAQPYVYFPTDSIVSLLYVMENGSSAEIAIVGNEGLVGISLLMGGATTPSRAIVQSAGHAFRMKANFIHDEFILVGPVQQLFLRLRKR
jgi:hypothetical protein